MEVDLIVKMMRFFGYGIIVLAMATLLMGIYNQAQWVEGEGKKPSIKVGSFFSLFLLGIFISGASLGVVVIAPGTAGIVFDRARGVIDEPLIREGIHVIVPYVQSVRIYDIRKRTYEMSSDMDQGQKRGDDSLDVQSQEGMTLKFDLSVIYRINPKELVNIYRSMGDDFEDKIIRPKIRATFREVTTRYKVTELISDKRTEIVAYAFKILSKILEKDGFILDDVLLRKVILPAEYVKVLKDKQIEEQNSLMMKYVLEKETQLAKQQEIVASGKKMAQIRLAEGDAQSMELRAKAKANEIFALAEAEANGLKMKADALSQNPNLVQQTVAERLSDNVKFVVVPDNSNMFFMDALEKMGIGSKK